MALLCTSLLTLPVRPCRGRGRRPLYPFPLSSPIRLVRHRFLFLRPNPLPSPSAGAGLAAFHLCEHKTLPPLDLDSLVVQESESDEELMAAVRLRVRTFYVEFEQSSGSDFSQNGEDRVVVASLDINQCLKLADELTGKRPEALGSGPLRAYLSNVCVAEELQRNGLGYAIVAKSKAVARSWGINDLYVHVAVDNEAAKRLYRKCGFVYENEEPTWQARFLGRPRRFLLWADLSKISL